MNNTAAPVRHVSRPVFLLATMLMTGALVGCYGSKNVEITLQAHKDGALVAVNAYLVPMEAWEQIKTEESARNPSASFTSPYRNASPQFAKALQPYLQDSMTGSSKIATSPYQMIYVTRDNTQVYRWKKINPGQKKDFDMQLN